jgi:hypothetical protein
VKRPGYTLHETLISLCVLGVVLGLVAHAATGQLRFFRGVGEIVAVRGQVGHASAVAARVLWGVSSPGGDIVIAQDSAIQLEMTLGTAVNCDSVLGRVTIPTSTMGNTLAAFFERPDVGDRVIALFSDSLGSTWLTLHVASPPVAGAGCAAFPNIGSAATVELREHVAVPAGAVLRFTRPLRLSLYRAADDRWYLGAKDWNGEADRFNAVQPVAGPLRPYSSDPSQTGLLFSYRDDGGAILEDPVETARIASVTIVSRAQSTRPVRVSGLKSASKDRHEDLTAVTVALRNAR